MRDVAWTIDGIRVDALEGVSPAIRTRGEEIELTCFIEAGFGGADAGPGMTLGGPDGGTLGGPDGGTLGTGALTSTRYRYEQLRQYGQYAGEGSTYQLIGGVPAVRENPQDEWPVESHIVPLEPVGDVPDQPGMWVLLTGYEDGSIVVDEYGVAGEMARLTFEAVVLGDLDEWADRAALLDALSTVTIQYDA